jgi:hypothetical protein
MGTGPFPGVKESKCEFHHNLFFNKEIEAALKVYFFLVYSVRV